MIRSVLTTLAVLFLTVGCAHTPPKANVTALRITLFDCGTIDVKDISVFSPGVDKGKPKTLTNTCYLIEHPKGRMLWDTGLSDEVAKTPGGITFKEAFHLSLQKGLLPQLNEFGIAPTDIRYLGLSHFHLDHIGNAAAFTHSTVLVQKEEYATAFAADAKEKGLSPDFANWIKRVTVQQLTGDFDVFGDGSVIIKRTPGHTPGHQSLYVRLPQSGPILLTGDLYHFTKNRQHRRVPSFNWDKKTTIASMSVFEAFAHKMKAKVWIQHDREQNAQLPHAPQSLD